ncbi:MAG: LacI family DNA-binding transcriptional regulator [Lachnospiraceae bacterium]|nr:LacI family DNA-binding transcriptional regulator [Lachnospiraceae bacterium]
MATLKDVAKLACVDVSTVSRALNNTSYVHPDTKKKIYDAASQLGYHPNVMAKALRQGKRHTIGVVIPRLHLAMFSEILQGIEAYSRERNYATLVCVTEDDPKLEKASLDRLRNGFIDGIIIAATGRNGHLIRDIQASGISVVQLMRRQERNISSVVADYEYSGYEAVKYLYKKGCREIGLISGSQHLAPYKGRYEGYRKAVRQLELSENISECDLPVNSFEYGYECTNQLLDDNYAIDGIIACVDIQGLGVFRALKDRGLDTDKVKVMSLTGHAIGGMLATSMTSLELPAHEMGEKAAALVIDEIEAPADNKPKPKHLVLNATLVEREST